MLPEQGSTDMNIHRHHRSSGGGHWRVCDGLCPWGLPGSHRQAKARFSHARYTILYRPAMTCRLRRAARITRGSGAQNGHTVPDLGHVGMDGLRFGPICTRRGSARTVPDHPNDAKPAISQASTPAVDANGRGPQFRLAGVDAWGGEGTPGADCTPWARRPSPALRSPGERLVDVAHVVVPAATIPFGSGFSWFDIRAAQDDPSLAAAVGEATRRVVQLVHARRPDGHPVVVTGFSQGMLSFAWPRGVRR